jgi:hypothetical protein
MVHILDDAESLIPFGESQLHQEDIHKPEREEGDLQREINHLEGSTHKWRRRKTSSEG